MSTATIDEAAEEESESEAGPPMCELAGGQRLEIKMAPACGQDNSELYDRWFKVVDATGSTWEVDACDEGSCETCTTAEGPPLLLSFSPVQVAPLADADRCLRVTAHRRFPVNPDACDYHTVVVRDHTNGNAGEVILIARNEPDVSIPMIEPGVAAMLAGFMPQLEPTQQCACDTYPGDCCQGVAPTEYEFAVGLDTNIPIDGKDSIMLDGTEYEFWGYDAFETGMCDEPLHISWALTRK